MKTKKIKMQKYHDMHEEVTVTGKDGTEITVRTHIPYEQKVEMAKEIAAQAIMIHDDSVTYSSYEEYAIDIMMTLKYYTNVDVSGNTPGECYDFVINNEIINDMMSVISEDHSDVLSIYYAIKNYVMATFKDDRSLTKAIRTSFGFLFNGEDVTESLAKAEAMKDTVYNAIGALREKEAEDANKTDPGTIRFGGNILNLSKK